MLPFVERHTRLVSNKQKQRSPEKKRTRRALPYLEKHPAYMITALTREQNSRRAGFERNQRKSKVERNKAVSRCRCRGTNETGGDARKSPFSTLLSALVGKDFPRQTNGQNGSFCGFRAFRTC